MGTTWHRWDSRNRIRLLHEVVRWFHALDTWTVYIRHWLVECLPSLTLTAHTASGDRLRRLDGYRRGGHRDSGNSGAGRLCCADEGALNWSHFDGRDRVKAGFGKLRMIAGLDRLNPRSAIDRPKNPLRGNCDLISHFKMIWVVQSLAQK